MMHKDTTRCRPYSIQLIFFELVHGQRLVGVAKGMGLVAYSSVE